MSEFHCAHAEQVKKDLPDEIKTADLADFFKIFGDYTRIRLLFAIKEKELCVHDLGQILGMQQSAVSHQLKTLRHYKLVRVRRQGQKSYYALNDHHVFEILEVGLQHLAHQEKRGK